MAANPHHTLPIIWSVAGNDSGGGAGLSADQRAAEAMGVHLCPVVAALTAQNSVAVTHMEAVSAELLEAQLATLAGDLPPRVIKTGLLGSAENARVLARCIDRLREWGPVALVIDPVLRASTGAALADAELLRAYRDELLPRATVITPNRREAAGLLHLDAADDAMPVPQQAQALQDLGAQAVCITGGDAQEALAHDWLLSPHAQGWLTLPRVATPHTHGTGCSFATGVAAALALGFVAADALVLAKMLTAHALRRAEPLGAGAGPVRAAAGFSRDPSLLPHLSLGREAPRTWAQRPRAAGPGLYAIVDSADRVAAVVSAGAPTVQLRIKRPPELSASEWTTQLEQAIARSLTTARQTGATLYINDHWRQALALGARALHLGQEDLLALNPEDHRRLAHARAEGVALGLSSHSLWELCRAAALQPDYIACGPVWPTTTKDMPWRPQGLDNLAWWAAMSPAPVVAIGGILTPEQLEATAACGAEGGCVVRGLGSDPATTLPVWAQAWARGQASAASARAPEWPHPSL